MTQTEIAQSIRMEDVAELFGVWPVRGKYLCPFHNDKKPSASIKNNKFHCFACGFHGDPIDFATGMGMDVATLAQQFGLEYKGVSDKQALERLRREREERERKQAVIDYQSRRICSCRQYFWQQVQDEDYFPIAFLDRLLERLPVGYDIDATLKALYRRYQN